ncbi:hypothetical protein TSAR_009536 [Trichomalopsis sarcophagae]|uniref:DNA-directed RNA polymerase I subunit RPA43 n=1 Tax=Trichomalopsis sarcophagae TaxID=543379 RepID=A0A232EL26_9HYME|nr:hypothetical protein TSAR_009536 [Trichomalopsis sarcophagae]
MGFKTITGVHWTNLELEGLIEDEDSCVYLEKVQKHLGLHPFHLTDLNAALREILNSNLFCYDAELNGLVLAYRNPKLLSSLGDIMYDTCFVHIDVEADFYIFRPEVGRSLKGFVNKKGTNHIGILLHKVFNVSVPKPDDEEDWPGDEVKVGQEVRFTPEEIDYKTRLPYICGLLREEDYLNGCRLFDEQIAATFESEFQEITRGNSSDFKKKITFKTENKRVVFDSDSEVEVNPEDDTEKKPSLKKLKIQPDDIEAPNKTPTKKRKRKSTLTSESDSELTQQNNTDLESPKNPSKKQKKNVVINKQSPNDTDDERPRKPSVSELTQRKIFDDSSEAESIAPSSPVKKHKKSKKNKVDESEDERNQKSVLKNLVSPALDSSVEQIEEDSIKKSKKRKKILVECLDTEDEKEYKSTIDKSLTANNSEAIFEVPQDVPKKRKKKKSTSETSDHLKKISAYDVVDTEDEKGYKSILKPLIESVEQSNQGDESEFKVPKKKKHKKKRTSSSSETELSFDPSTVTVKDEPESETEEVRDMRRKLKKAKKEAALENGDNSELTDKETKESLKGRLEKSSEEHNDAEVSLKKVKKSKLSQESNVDSDSGVETGKPTVKSEEEQEKRRKLKKEKHNNESSK